jgi:hypothetical protein
MIFLDLLFIKHEKDTHAHIKAYEGKIYLKYAVPKNVKINPINAKIKIMEVYTVKQMNIIKRTKS